MDFMNCQRMPQSALSCAYDKHEHSDTVPTSFVNDSPLQAHSSGNIYGQPTEGDVSGFDGPGDDHSFFQPWIAQCLSAEPTKLYTDGFGTPMLDDSEGIIGVGISDPLFCPPAQPSDQIDRNDWARLHTKSMHQSNLQDDDQLLHGHFELIAPFPHTSHENHLLSSRGTPHHCDYDGCMMKFGRPSELKKHKKIHAGPEGRRHSCNGCDMKFIYPKDLKRHRRSKHPSEEANKLYFCDEEGCDYKRRGFQRRDKLLRHQQRKHMVSPSSSVSSGIWHQHPSIDDQNGVPPGLLSDCTLPVSTDFPTNAIDGSQVSLYDDDRGCLGVH